MKHTPASGVWPRHGGAAAAGALCSYAAYISVHSHERNPFPWSGAPAAATLLSCCSFTNLRASYRLVDFFARSDVQKLRLSNIPPSLVARRAVLSIKTSVILFVVQLDEVNVKIQRNDSNNSRVGFYYRKFVVAMLKFIAPLSIGALRGAALVKQVAVQVG